MAIIAVEEDYLPVANFAIPSERLEFGAQVVTLSDTQRALWRLGMPILDAGAVAEYKTRAKRVMLWRAIRWLLLAMTALVALVGLGRQWNRAAAVGAAAVALASLFAWLVSRLDLRWSTVPYDAFRRGHSVPGHVSTAATALLEYGVAPESIAVEYLKSDPILFVEDDEKRYDLIIW
jgi:hypothetical protein